MRKLFNDRPFWSRLFFAAILVLAATFGHAQGGPGQSNYPATVTTQSGAPSGNCPGTNVISLNISNGAVYSCPVAGSSWTAIGGTGSGTVSANSGTAGAMATYAAAGGSTTVGPDAGFVSNGTGAITLGAAAVGAGSITAKGSTSGSVSVGCQPAATCLTFGNSGTGATFKAYSTGTNCQAAGTAANPSVVTCTSAASGGVACSASASTGTCVVNTSAVSANSVIIVSPTSAVNGLTCNATADTGLTGPRVLSQSAGISFTLNLGTFTTTAECFYYWIVD